MTHATFVRDTSLFGGRQPQILAHDWRSELASERWRRSEGAEPSAAVPHHHEAASDLRKAACSVGISGVVRDEGGPSLDEPVIRPLAAPPLWAPLTGPGPREPRSSLLNENRSRLSGTGGTGGTRRGNA